MNLRGRLRRLERSVGAAGCPACRDRRGRFLQRTGREQADGSVVFEEPAPAPCRRCGQVPEHVVEIVEVVVESPADVARVGARTAAASGDGRAAP